MVTVTKKHQISLALVVVAFATIMIAGTFASSTNNLAFAGGSHGKKVKVGQSISQACDQDQRTSASTSGLLSPPIASGINAGICVNANLAGNTANVDNSDSQ
jgi:hypothetical protein